MTRRRQTWTGEEDDIQPSSKSASLVLGWLDHYADLLESKATLDLETRKRLVLHLDKIADFVERSEFGEESWERRKKETSRWGHLKVVRRTDERGE